MERVARVWVAFTLYGGLIGLAVFLGSVFGLGQSEAYAAIVAVVIGVLLGFGLAHILGARKLASRILGFLYYVSWFTNN